MSKLLSGKAQPPITQERFEEYVSRCCMSLFRLQVLTGFDENDIA